MVENRKKILIPALQGMKGVTPQNYALRSHTASPQVPPSPPPPPPAEVSGLQQQPVQQQLIEQQQIKQQPSEPVLNNQPPPQQQQEAQQQDHQEASNNLVAMTHVSLTKFADERSEVPALWWSLFESYQQCLGMSDAKAIGSLALNLSGQALMWF